MKIKSRILIISSIIGVAFALGYVSGFTTLLLYSKAVPPMAAITGNNEPQQAPQPQEELRPSDYAKKGISWEDAQKSNKPVALTFYVDWCHYCQGFAPILNKFREEYSSKYNFVYINCEKQENQSVMREFNVNSFPAFFLVDKKHNKKEYVEPSEYQNHDAMKSRFDSFLTGK